jgi:hypothetical protein
MVNVAGEVGGYFQHLPHSDAPFHNKAFVESHQLFNPGVNQQVVANGNLGGGPSLIEH